MARGRKRDAAAERVLSPTALAELAAGVTTPAELDAVFKRLKQQLTEQILQGELTAHLGSPPGETPVGPNARHGTSPKTVLTDEGPLDLAIPRDRASTFAPQLVPKGVRRLPGFDQKAPSLYARGLTVREPQAHLEECYQTAVSPDLISTVTDAIRPRCRRSSRARSRPCTSRWPSTHCG